MLHILGIVAAVLIAILLLVLVVASTRPGAFEVKRSKTLRATPDRIFSFLNDFHQWPTWSPWEKLDPGMTRTHSGAASGKGAIYAWKGNKKVGEGRMEILDSAAPAKVTIKLDFFKPFEAHNTAEFTLQAKGPETELTWAMRGSQPFMMKVMSLFMNMDQMIGKDFETGLANLKAAAEA